MANIKYQRIVTSDSSDEEEIVPKKSAVPRKKAPAKVGGKYKLSEDSNSDSSDEDEIVPKKSSHAKVQCKEEDIEQKAVVVKSRSRKSKLRKKAKDQSDK